MQQREYWKYLDRVELEVSVETSRDLKTWLKMSSVPLRGPGQRHQQMKTVLSLVWCGTWKVASRMSGMAAQLTTTQYLSQPCREVWLSSPDTEEL